MSDLALTASLQRLVNELKKLPGIGTRSAERIAFHLLKASRDEALLLSRAIEDTKNEIRPCSRCFNLAEGELCSICSNPRRDQAQIFVVEQPNDLISLESTGLISGVYHVLMGHIAPLDNIDAADLTIDALVRRVRAGGVREIVLATNPNLEGDATALHITSLLRDSGVAMTRLARGLAPGAQIEYANRSMLEAALRGRGEF